MPSISTKIFKHEAKFIAGVSSPAQLPSIHLPQVVFAGKSNVGKSSLINKVCNRKNLARVSHTPGRTQQINFFSIANKLVLVDLPGYGFAKVPTSTRNNWQDLIMYYLKNSTNLVIVNLLIDARRGIKNNDLQIIDLLKSIGVAFQLVFTKADKITSLDKFIEETKTFLSSIEVNCSILLTSTKDNKGIKELQASMIKEI